MLGKDTFASMRRKDANANQMLGQVVLVALVLIVPVVAQGEAPSAVYRFW